MSTDLDSMGRRLGWLEHRLASARAMNRELKRQLASDNPGAQRPPGMSDALDHRLRTEAFGYVHSAGYAQRWTDAQAITTVVIKGVTYPRVRFGDEEYFTTEWYRELGKSPDDPCDDCGVERGEFHLIRCDVEECPRHDGQALSCGCHWSAAGPNGAILRRAIAQAADPQW